MEITFDDLIPGNNSGVTPDAARKELARRKASQGQGFTPEQQQALANARARMNASAGQSDLTPEQRQALANAAQRMKAAEISFDDLIPAPPAGMVLDPNAGQMVDTEAVAQRQNEGFLGKLGTAGATAIKGIPFVGEYFDEAIGATAGPVAQEVARQRVGQFEESNPKTATGLKVAGGISAAIPAAMAAAPLVPGAMVPASLGGKVITEGALGLAGGATEGAISGYGAGTDADSRASEAMQRAKFGSIFGVGAGVAAPVISAAAKPVIRRAVDRFSLSRNARQSGLSQPARDVLSSAMEADGSLDGRGLQNIRRAGPDAMLADSGPNARKILDTAIQRSGKAGNLAREAIESRATNANARITRTFDDVLGQPTGIRKAARDIAGNTAQARKMAYDAAYSQPINYADDAGRQIEDVMSRIPDRVKRKAIESANEAMTAAGQRNMQIFADIADDGTVTFRQPPNVQQLDYIKRALGEIGAESVDQFGRKTAEGMRAAGLAKELRDTLGDAVPEYGIAVKLGGDKIAEDSALDLGRKLLRSSTTREAVADMAGEMTDAQRQAAVQGLRSTLDEQLAQVKRTVQDGNIDAREALKAIKDLSSRANREKVSMIVGDDAATRLFRDLDEATAALDLRAGVSANSQTFARQSMDEIIGEASEPGIFGTLAEGEPIKAGKKVFKALTGRSDTTKREATDKTYGELAKVLTEKVGRNPAARIEVLSEIVAKAPKNRALVDALAKRAGFLGGAATYQTGTRFPISRGL